MNLPDAIAQSDFLRDLTPSALQDILASARECQRADGAFFFLEEEEASRAYLVLEGQTKLLQTTAGGHQIVLGYVVPGQVFGVIAVLEEASYPLSAQALGKCRALSWERDALYQLLTRHPRLGLNIMRIMAGKIYQFQKRLQEMATQQVEQRIARTILRLAAQVGRKVEEGVLLDMPLSRQDLAEMTGTTLYTVSRVLKDWQKRGLVEPGRMNILIRQPHGLVIIAEGLSSAH